MDSIQIQNPKMKIGHARFCYLQSIKSCFSAWVQRPYFFYSSRSVAAGASLTSPWASQDGYTSILSEMSGSATFVDFRF